MALSASTIYEINAAATAGNVNAGGFNIANANFMTDLTTDADTANTSAPVLSSATYTFVAGDVDHWVYIQSGTNWTVGFYKIASVAGGKATLSAAIGSSSVSQIVNNRYGVNTVVGCATVATPTNGVFSIDYSRSTASPFASTDLASTNGTTNPATVTSATNPFGPNHVGNLLHVTAGTNWTQGWYEIVSVSGTTATLDRAVGAAATLSSGTGKVGGALSLQNSGDDAMLELLYIGTATAASKFFVVGNTSYTMAGTIALAADANNAFHASLEGYVTNRGDRPTGSTRPLFICGANLFTWNGANCDVHSLQFTGTGTSLFNAGNANRVFNVKATQLSSTADRPAIDTAASSIEFWNCEAISYRGVALNIDQTNCFVHGGYYHDSNIGIIIGTNALSGMENVIVASNVTYAVNCSTVNSSFSHMNNNTFYGAEAKLGTAINLVASSLRWSFTNNIVYGFVSGVVSATAGATHFDDYNNYYNNTTDVNDAANWQKGTNDKALDPQFVNVQQRTGSTATTGASNTFTQSGATFQTWGVTAGTHYLRIVSGTGVTAGIYGIASVDSETQITTDITLTADATADKVWAICTGLNWAVGTNMKAVGFPGATPGTSTTAYEDIGAVQRQEAGGASSGGGGIFNSSIIRAA